MLIRSSKNCTLRFSRNRLPRIGIGQCDEVLVNNKDELL